MVKPRSVFLRVGCILPDCLNPLLRPVCANWGLVEEISAPIFDTMIRQAAWHFMWMRGSSSRMGFASKEEEATHHALIHALDGVGKRFNGAELESVKVKKYLGLYFSRVTLQPRQIQQQTSLDVADGSPLRTFPAV
ncbi:MAG: hypothetical protein WB561_03570 [Terracidiphilus sp.]